MIDYQESQPAAIRVIGNGDKERREPLSPAAQTALMLWDGADALAQRAPDAREPAQRVGLVSAVWQAVRPADAGAQHPGRDGRAARRAGLDVAKVSPHKLRHSLANALSQPGRTLDEIKALLGRKSIQTTTIYAHTSAARVNAAALPDVIGLAAVAQPLRVIPSK
ncbi:tyrosine-type recombinase/integrase [Deinococcus marmoris]|uniref:Tyrosine recombinase XerD n=1 Tax=Deinococcus marmoris TaxID=249408 RepID=A0A1U7NVG6_9DEIO|nr:tyrosine-type recombinase/integrase [Deinococcus marmoris]OLV16897.1 Tyrosine recombinase XerD [Deinococcus marmoris]